MELNELSCNSTSACGELNKGWLSSSSGFFTLGLGKWGGGGANGWGHVAGPGGMWQGVGDVAGCRGMW